MCYFVCHLGNLSVPFNHSCNNNNKILLVDLLNQLLQIQIQEFLEPVMGILNKILELKTTIIQTFACSDIITTALHFTVRIQGTRPMPMPYQVLRIFL